MMAAAQVEDGARLFYRNKDANTYGILNASEDFLNKYPDLTKRVLAVYEQARKYCLANYDDEKRVFMDVTKLPGEVVDIQLKERTDLHFNRIGPEQRATILQAGLALRQAGVVPATVDVKKSLDDLVDDRFVTGA
jgi:sulfonate transport system substrate-binding protein